VRRILETRSDLRWLDPSGEWFWLTSVARNRLLSRVQKVLAVQPRIPLSELHAALERDYQPLKIPKAVLSTFCACIPGCSIAGGQVHADVSPENGLFSGGEAVICSILRAHGGALPLAALQKQCLAYGIKRANLWRVLSFSPVVRRFDKEVYGLIGAHGAAKQVAESGRA
jgi:hypothetical protein